ncbi:glycosyltransferase involved in cell wall biosynthesis [Gramella sp. Hel_I_59]|uniref:glycosyltransferase n=1 Tax=Gramella sp. Hel_I_59 TaxID=1249978 RepID=UPI00114E7B37|nr:glycosyltransferase [Gramella sp. Hel_I_59]TQI70507.1 glycosyltransferase involved in cell wall biosynthesis [Gramella sp. Hel_I_59]
MKIAILAHNKFPIAEPYAGGLEMITHQLVQTLMERGHEVHLYALSGSDPQFDVTSLDIVQVANNELTESKIDELMYRNVLEIIESIDYDVVHNHSMHELPIIWGASSRHQFLTSFHTPVFDSIHSGLENISGRDHSEKFSVVSKKLGETYAHLLPEKNVVYNGIDTTAWTFSKSTEVDKLCWIGRICKEKAPHLAIDYALKANKKIVLAGPLSNSEYFKEYVEPRLELEGVEYIGHLKHTGLNKLIGSSEATLFTSVWDEPYGLVIAESLACGTPVVSFNVGAAPEILTKETGFLVELEDEAGFVNAIKSCTKLDRNDCRERAIDFCDKGQMVDAYENLYEKMISENLKKVAV